MNTSIYDRLWGRLLSAVSFTGLYSLFRFRSSGAAASDSGLRSYGVGHLLLWLLSFAVGISAGMSQAAEQEQKEKQQQQVQRLVSAGGGITEVVYLLGAEDMLVATDTTSLYPPAAQETAKIGYLRMLSAEGLLSLKPDAVITSTEAGPPVVLDQLRSAGVRLEVVDADHSWQEVKNKVEAVGRITGRVQQAAALQKKLDAQWADTVAQVRTCLPEGSIRPKVLFVLAHGRTPSVAGQGTAADALIRMTGGVNAMQGFTGYRALNDEGLLKAAPDIIVTTSQGLKTVGGEKQFWSAPAMQLIPAYANRDLIHMDALEMLGFGPRFAQSVRTVNTRMLRMMHRRGMESGTKALADAACRRLLGQSAGGESRVQPEQQTQP